MVKNKSKKGRRNCKDGLTSRQEHLARQIRRDLLDDTKKKKHYLDLKNLWITFCIQNDDIWNEINFSNYVKENIPEFHSAFKRLQLSMIDIIKTIK